MPNYERGLPITREYKNGEQMLFHENTLEFMIISGNLMYKLQIEIMIYAMGTCIHQEQLSNAFIYHPQI